MEDVADRIATLLAEHAHKCGEVGSRHDHFGESGTRRTKMDHRATRLLGGRLAQHRQDLINDVHLIYLRRVYKSPKVFVDAHLRVDSGRVDGFVLISMDWRARWYRRNEMGPNAHPDVENAENADPIGDFIEAERWERLRGILTASLEAIGPEESRLIRWKLGGKSTAEIASILEITEGTARVRLSRAIATLRDRIGGDGLDER